MGDGVNVFTRRGEEVWGVEVKGSSGSKWRTLMTRLKVVRERLMFLASVMRCPSVIPVLELRSLPARSTRPAVPR